VNDGAAVEALLESITGAEGGVSILVNNAGITRDNLLMRIMDVLLAFPSLLLAIAIVTVIGPGLINTQLAIGVVAIPIYARVMRFFVLTCCVLFLIISLYIDVVGWFFEAIHRGEWTEGLQWVPLFALGNIFLGIYYNLSIWYKLTDKNQWGAWITVIGAAITIGLNIWLIPEFHYLGAAIATVSCYATMMILSYWSGQKFYPVPYDLKKLSMYIGSSVILVLIHRYLISQLDAAWFNLLVATVFLGAFLLFAWKEFQLDRKAKAFN
jgi:O-antigen/teichoic acid export membrane protein